MLSSAGCSTNPDGQPNRTSRGPRRTSWSAGSGGDDGQRPREEASRQLRAGRPGRDRGGGGGYATAAGGLVSSLVSGRWRKTTAARFVAHAPDDRLARGEPVNTGWRPDWRRYRQSIRGPTATTCVRGAAVGAGLDEAMRPPAHATHHGSSTSLTLPSPIVSYRPIGAARPVLIILSWLVVGLLRARPRARGRPTRFSVLCFSLPARTDGRADVRGGTFLRPVCVSSCGQKGRQGGGAAAFSAVHSALQSAAAGRTIRTVLNDRRSILCRSTASWTCYFLASCWSPGRARGAAMMALSRAATNRVEFAFEFSGARGTTAK